ncbi:MAG: sugar transferase, partial [Opitutaceae bacterium]
TIEKYLWLAPVVIILGPAFLSGQSLYDSGRRTWSHQGAAMGILLASTYLTLALVLILFLARENYARSVVLLVGGMGGFLVYARHELVAWHDSVRRSEMRRKTVWIGLPSELNKLRSAMSASERDALESVADLDPGPSAPDDLVRLLHKHAINLSIVNMAGLAQNQISPFLAVCEREGVEVLLRPGLLSSSPYRLVSEVFAGEPVFYYRAQSANPNQLIIKQLLDYVLAAVLLLLLSPLMLMVAAAIALTSRGPLRYRQPRAGLNGKPFTMYKFRSMRLGAELMQDGLAGQNEMKGPVFKLSEDPRVTPLGRVLRRHSVDELPQLWNVLRGEMSMVGPRPLPVGEVGRFSDDAHRRRLSVKPGLTCLWQISGRNDIADFEDWVRLDLAYIDRWSLWLDLKILIATLPVALFGRGGR